MTPMNLYFLVGVKFGWGLAMRARKACAIGHIAGEYYQIKYV